MVARAVLCGLNVLERPRRNRGTYMGQTEGFRGPSFVIMVSRDTYRFGIGFLSVVLILAPKH